MTYSDFKNLSGADLDKLVDKLMADFMAEIEKVYPPLPPAAMKKQS